MKEPAKWPVAVDAGVEPALSGPKPDALPLGLSPVSARYLPRALAYCLGLPQILVRCSRSAGLARS